MPAVLHALSDRKELLTNEIYLLSAVTALQRVTETLVHFISPYLQDIMFQVCRPEPAVAIGATTFTFLLPLSAGLPLDPPHRELVLFNLIVVVLATFPALPLSVVPEEHVGRQPTPQGPAAHHIQVLQLPGGGQEGETEQFLFFVQ